VKTFYLSGQRTFGNRGCEAIVRSTVALLRAQFGDVEVLVPSVDVERDRAQWPDAAENGVRFVRAYMPKMAGYWVHLQRLPLPFLKRAGWPFPMPDWLKQQLSTVDAVLAVGGDNYSLDYRIPSPILGLDRFAMDLGKPVILWGASVGPFDKEPGFVPAVRNHLSRMNFVAVRESVSYRYLTENLGLANVVQMADPAFMLGRETVDYSKFWPECPNGVLGVNISSLIERYKRPARSARASASGRTFGGRRHLHGESARAGSRSWRQRADDAARAQCRADKVRDQPPSLLHRGENALDDRGALQRRSNGIDRV
jgi:colanic acid/amylovoran biosynthesis protein